MSVREITLEWVAKAEEDAAVSEREAATGEDAQQAQRFRGCP